MSDADGENPYGKDWRLGCVAREGGHNDWGIALEILRAAECRNTFSQVWLPHLGFGLRYREVFGGLAAIREANRKGPALERRTASQL
jgi:hypothetical protein